MKVTDELIANFVVHEVKPEEFLAVLEAAKTDPEIAEKVIMGFLAVRFLNEIFTDVDRAIDDALEKATKEALKKAAKNMNVN